MRRQQPLPREAFLDKLNIYLAAHIVRTRGAGAKISRETIARQLGDYHRITLHKWLTGSSSMPRSAVEAFCTLVGLSDEERHDLLQLGGYIEILARAPHFQKQHQTEEDPQPAITGIDQQVVTSSSDRPAQASAPIPVARTTAVSAAPNYNQRCADLATNIRETLELIKEYEDQRRLTDDPKTQRRATSSIADLRAQLREYEREERDLGCK